MCIRKNIEESTRDPGWLCVLKCNKRHRIFPVGTALTENKPSLTALKHPGISPGQEVLFLLLSDLCMPFTADEGSNTPPCHSTLHGLLRVWLWRSSSCSSGGNKKCQWNYSESFYSGLPFDWHLCGWHADTWSKHNKVEKYCLVQPKVHSMKTCRKILNSYAQVIHFCHSLLFLKSVLSLLKDELPSRPLQLHSKRLTKNHWVKKYITIQIKVME